MTEKDVLLDVGKLAGMVAGQLNAVDRSTTLQNSHGGSANKININNFIHSIKNNSLPMPIQQQPMPDAFVGAYIDEAQVQNMQPDTSQFSVKVGIPHISNVINESRTENIVQQIPDLRLPVPFIEKSGINISELAEDLKSIKSTLNNINNTFSKISGMMGKVFNYITEKERKNI